ncbi:LOW QUALITY PROTEIN: ribitol-5-phosphate transferase FKTN [Menidia menidia]
MPRANRTLLLWLLGLCSCAFLLFQVHYYRKYVSKHPGPAGLSPAGGSSPGHAQWQTLRSFLALARRFRLPLFLGDTASLELLSQNAAGRRGPPPRGPPPPPGAPPPAEPPCSVLCTGRPITSFLLLASQWTYQPGLLLAARQQGFQVLELGGPDPRLADAQSGGRLPLHLLLRRHGYAVQVVFLYQRSGGFLWHGALRLPPHTDPHFTAFRELDYGQHPGAYDRPRLVLSVLDGLDVPVPLNVSGFLSQRRGARFLECPHREAQQFLQRYPDDCVTLTTAPPPAVAFRLQVRGLLTAASKALTALQVPFWISSGTCLGWFRQCGVVSWSRDVDLGVFISDYRPDMVQAFKTAGLTLKNKFGKVSDSLELSFLWGGVKLDVFFFYGDGDLLWNGGTQARTGRKFRYWFPRFSLCWAELLGVRVRVPCETRDYVEANYGQSWGVPQKRWDWKASPSNVQENGAWPRGEWAELIQVY